MPGIDDLQLLIKTPQPPLQHPRRHYDLRGLIQPSDTGTIDIIELVFDPRPWFIALFVTPCYFLWDRVAAGRETETEEAEAS